MSKKSREDRKRKRIQNMQEDSKKVKRAEVVIKEHENSQARIRALNYLVLWKKHNKGKLEEGEAWKFNKTRQVWLLKNCYNLH